MADEPERERSKSLEKFLLQLIREYRSEYAAIPEMRDALILPIAGWLLAVEQDTDSQRPN